MRVGAEPVAPFGFALGQRLGIRWQLQGPVEADDIRSRRDLELRRREHEVEMLRPGRAIHLNEPD